MSAAARLVLLHPWGNDASAWNVDPDLAWFAGWRQALPFAMPAPADAISSAAVADSLVAATDAPIDLVGIADSCAVALAALLRHPTRIRSAVLVNPTGNAAPVRPGPVALPEMLAASFTPLAIRTGNPGVRYVAALANSRPELFAGGPRTDAPDAAALARIAQPVSLVCGTGGASAGPARAIHQQLAHGRIEIVPAGLFTHLEFPDALMGAIYHHLTWARTGEPLARPLLFSPLGSMGEWREATAAGGRA